MMEEQFGGRTDDALFYDDDFEPVTEESKPLYETPPEPVAPAQPQPPAPAAAPAAQPEQRPAQSDLPAPKALAQSRHATRSPRPPKHPKPRAPSPKDVPPSTSPAPSSSASGPTPAAPGAGSNARLASGANPRTKLTEDELAAKMERMRILAAEKARKHEVAERDEQQHAAAYARDMEEARKRRAAEAERRKRGEEDKRKMDEERARNRERKLKAMGREGNWDEGKEEEQRDRGFRGANGGVRGVRGGGLAGSRFADEPPPARGRGGGRGGRGGRRDGNGHAERTEEKKKQEAPALTGEQFPALSEAPAKPEKPRLEGAYTAALTKGVKAGTLETGAKSPADSLPGSPPLGRWDDEMEAADERKRASGR